MHGTLQLICTLLRGKGMQQALLAGRKQNQSRYFFYCLFILLTAVGARPVVAQETLAGVTSNGGAEGGGTAFSLNTNGPAFEVVKTFANWGKNPGGELIYGADGFLYGMTNTGGIYNDGTLFKISPAGAITILHNFYSLTDGANPWGGLTLAANGDIYGMTNAGGTNTYGTIFRYSAAGQFSVLRHFAYHTDGANPFGTLVIGKDGNFYGLTRKGGSTGNGTIFRISSAGNFAVIKTFSADPKIDGGSGYGSLCAASDSNFYGITYNGGTFNSGTIFRITLKGEYTVLKHLKTAEDGYAYTNSLVEGPDGYLYGMNHYGGSLGQGTIFKISKAGDYKLLRPMNYRTDGSGPVGSLIVASATEMYGVSKGGGANGLGTVFSISTTGVFKLLKSFTEADGRYPKAGLIKHPDGGFYGMTSEGGAGFYGTVYRILSTGSFSVLNSFSGGQLGNIPMESLIQAKDFAYYGTTISGGTYNHGTVFKLCDGKFTVIKSFNKAVDGGMPKGSLMQASDGNFYGTTSEGGLNNAGTIFRLTPSGAYSVVYHLNSPKDGGNPQGSLTEGTAGILYGTTTNGGTTNGGTIFRVTTKSVFTVLKHLVTATDGANPEGSLVKITDTSFLGMTPNGATVFKVTASGNFTVLKKFTSTTDGNYPAGNLVKANDGNYYGITNAGGSTGAGTIFRISDAGVFKVIKHLNSATDGYQAKGSLVLAADGNLYGLTSNGGAGKAGTIFRINPANSAFAVLRSFDLKKDGGAPFGSLVVQKPNPLKADEQIVAATEDIAKPIVLTGSGATPLIYTVVVPPKNGTITGGTTANRTYTPAKNYAGKDSLYFKVSYGCWSSAPAKVIINIAAVDDDAPVLDSIGSPTASVGAVLSFQAKATEYDKGQILTYSIIGGPAGAVIDAKTGVFKWTTAKVGSFPVTVRVSDNGKPVLFDEEKVTLKVTANLPPVLDSIKAKTVKASTLLTFKATAKDSDPATVFTYSLLTPPAGAVIDSKTGVFRWTPAAGGVFRFTVKVTDNGIPALFDTELVTVNVVSNQAPVLDSVRTKTVKAGKALSFRLTAKDPDAGQKLKYSFTGSLTGAKLDSVSGLFSWTPDRAGTFRVIFTVTDNGTPVMKDAETVSIIVQPNIAPVLDSIRSRTATAGTALSFKASATDADPGQRLTYSLISPPAGAAINATTGVFTWTPATAGAYNVRFRVSDNGTPVLYDDEVVKITVAAKSVTSAAVALSGEINAEVSGEPAVYPNPVQTTCTVDLKKSIKHATVRIANASGGVVHQEAANLVGETLVRLNLVNLKAGQYYITILDGNHQWTFKIMKL